MATKLQQTQAALDEALRANAGLGAENAELRGFVAVLNERVLALESALDRIQSLPVIAPDVTDFHVWVDLQRQMRGIAYEARVPPA